MGGRLSRAPVARSLAASGTGFESAPGVVLLVSCVLTAVVAHSSAGGALPGPAGSTIIVLLLAPLAWFVNRVAQGPVALAAVGVVGQLVAHVAMSLVTPMQVTGASMPMPMPMPAAGSGGAHGAGIASTAHGAHVLQGAPGSGTSIPGMISGHLLHMGPAMAAAHVLAALATAGLVTFSLLGIRRAVGRARRVLLLAWTPRTPLRRVIPAAADVPVPERPYLVVLGGRAPPAFS